MTRLKQEGSRQHKNVRVSAISVTKDLTNHKDDLLQELTRRVQGANQGIAETMPIRDKMLAELKDAADKTFHKMNCLANDILDKLDRHKDELVWALEIRAPQEGGATAGIPTVDEVR